MRVVVAGGTGFLGRALVAALRAEGHHVCVLTRRPSAPEEVGWTPDGTAGAWAAAVDGAEVLVNLAGAGIADRRWSQARKRVLATSRLDATRSLVAAALAAAAPPRVFVSASAVGYYGDRGDELLTEEALPGEDFLGRLAQEWEAAARAVEPIGTRLALVRTGIALAPDGGALGKMLLPFRLGLGGRLGTGRQYMPWIHRGDWVRLVRWLIAEPAAQGAFNATAPNPVTNAEFTRALARALGRPAVLPVPALALRLIFGELASALLGGQRAVPTRALAMGFRFDYPEIGAALASLLGRR